MLQADVTDIVSKNTYSITFFEDDTIDTIRTRIAVVTNSHPDRLFILAGLKLFPDYYVKDPRNWEALFDRLSYDGHQIAREVFQEYQTNYRVPGTAVVYNDYSRDDWNARPEELRPFFEPVSEFTEYRIFGVQHQKSYILPFEPDARQVAKIPSARLPIPDGSALFNTLYKPDQVVRFFVRQYDEKAEAAMMAYYPNLTPRTPSQLSGEAVQLLEKNTRLLDELLKIEVPEPKRITIDRTRFYIPWVTTNFGSAVQTRFEQMFYGLTVTEETPHITLFTRDDQVSRHKFFAKSCKNKKPFLDMEMWKSWWSSTKPQRSMPTLILYRGTANNNFDRIAITSRDMVVSTYRPEGSTETIEELKTSCINWIKTLDSILPFVDKEDLHVSRWELQDLSYVAKYEKKLDSASLLRFDCLKSIFDIADRERSKFRLLRTDHSNSNLSAVDLKLLQLRKDNPALLKAELVAEDLGVTTQRARELIAQLDDKLEDDPRLAERAFRGYPTLLIGPDFVLISSVSNMDLSTRYANLLRYILSDEDSPLLDKICKKRVEKVEAQTVIAVEDVQLDAALAEEFSDMFAELGDEEPKEEEEKEEAKVPLQDKIAIGKKSSSYGYFMGRLREFDPKTFDPSDSNYPKKCQKPYQPVIISDRDLKRLSGSPYDVKSYLEEDQMIDVVEPSGTVVCPEYWCMRDNIPLRDSQLLRDGGAIRCPVCKGKLQMKETDNPREFPLVKRETGFIFPGYSKDLKSPTNGRPLPCCFKKSKLKATKDVEEKTDQKYYILSDDKSVLPLRLAFLSEPIISSLQLNEKYELFKNAKRIQSGMSGFFRVGLGKASETLPDLLGLKTKTPRPKDAIDCLLKCSFFATWQPYGSKYVKEIEEELQKKEPFDRDPIARNGIARLVSGVDEAFEEGRLSPIQELEYTAVTFRCDVFRINRDTNTLQCIFYYPITRPRTRGIAILQSGNEVDILCHVVRVSRGFQYVSNIFESPFKKDTYVILEKLRNAACSTEIPSFNQAMGVIRELLMEFEADDFYVVLDTYGKGQAFYVPSKFILPFQSSPLPDMAQAKIHGFREITKENLPTKENTIKVLEMASKLVKGYEYKEDLYNVNGETVEILTSAGLRIPIQATGGVQREAGEVYETLQDTPESRLTFQPPSDQLKKIKNHISYTSEVYEFLLFQLTKDLENDYRELRTALREVSPKVAQVEPLLKQWFEETVQFLDLKKGTEFVSKIRTPCGQFKSADTCSSNLCGWDGKVCRTQINTTLQKDKVFHRLLTSLVDNSKTRAVVLDGRTTPFFSTILYLEMPNEVIMTDFDLA